jgi:hypothetical protein
MHEKHSPEVKIIGSNSHRGEISIKFRSKQFQGKLSSQSES